MNLSSLPASRPREERSPYLLLTSPRHASSIDQEVLDLNIATDENTQKQHESIQSGRNHILRNINHGRTETSRTFPSLCQYSITTFKNVSFPT
ncbi:uncharacterized protein L3040_004283 [Drepanopeziza brunnea f. sp. 'multigermtubi']|uniref:uncharacterized protein n=1 Tax=Drepanopeziza brunnea f. sp. 'multigermtubi' TaxID=698441 RepID=UPI00238955A6|nr:hypothetical protein L3040_004283 [Drepanopeziza brunnea f. sp. 'multigermtubi']